MSAQETEQDRLEKLANRFTELAVRLEEREQRADVVDDAVVALRRYGVGEDFYSKHTQIESGGVVFVSRHLNRRPVAAIYRPDEVDLDAMPPRADTSPSPVRREEFAALLRRYADEFEDLATPVAELESLPRPREEVFRDVILLLANEPGCVFQDASQDNGRIYVSTRLTGVRGTTLVQVRL